MSTRAFYEPKLLSEFVGEFLGSRDMSRPLSDQERIKVFTSIILLLFTLVRKKIKGSYLEFSNSQVKRALKGVRVEVRRQDYKRRYKVQGLTAQPISQLK